MYNWSASYDYKVVEEGLSCMQPKRYKALVKSGTIMFDLRLPLIGLHRPMTRPGTNGPIKVLYMRREISSLVLESGGGREDLRLRLRRHSEDVGSNTSASRTFGSEN